MKRKLTFIALGIVFIGIIATVVIISNAHNEKIDTNIDLSNVPSALNPDTKEFIIKAGVNTPGLENDGWFFNYGMNYLRKKSTFLNIKEKGFDHVRVPIDLRLFYDEKNNSLNEKLMKKYDRILDLAEWAGLYVIIDFHGWYDITPTEKADHDLFLKLWRLVAERYQNRSNYVIFELMNEPSLKTAPSFSLNILQREAVEAIRETNPTRLILCAAPDGNQPWLLNEVSIIEEDKNLAVAVHIYHPGDFTHQGYWWAGRERNKQVRLTDEMLAELQWNLKETKKFMEKTGIPVMLNEFGMNLEISDKQDRYTYLGTITEFCNKNNIPWTIWRYNWKEMGISDNGKWKEDIVDVLFLKDVKD